jgi:KDO2-lipid IV(A) lauroyltransferase
MTVPQRKRIKRSVRSAIVRAAIRLLSLLPLGAALALRAGATGTSSR